MHKVLVAVAIPLGVTCNSKAHTASALTGSHSDSSLFPSLPQSFTQQGLAESLGVQGPVLGAEDSPQTAGITLASPLTRLMEELGRLKFHKHGLATGLHIWHLSRPLSF